MLLRAPYPANDGAADGALPLRYGLAVFGEPFLRVLHSPFLLALHAIRFNFHDFLPEQSEGVALLPGSGMLPLRHLQNPICRT